AVFVWTWALGSQPVFLTRGSYAVGALVLLGLNVFALACHELGHALATKHVGRRVPAAGFLVYFGIPSVFVDTTDVWMAGRRARPIAWLAARARRRPPTFAALDREGRLVALYGMLSLAWLVIAVNLAYRIYLDRVGGLVTGLWRAGWPQRVLLLAVVAGLAAP